MDASTDRPHEVTDLHTRILKCALEVEDSRAYWVHASLEATPKRAFDEYWFGAKSLPRAEVLLTNMRARFAVFPAALAVLSRWRDMSPDTRTRICHWHLQLSDPMYRRFTGSWLVDRRQSHRPEVTRDLVLAWVADLGKDRWTLATKLQFASKLLSAAYSANLIGTNRDPRPLTLPRVPDDALEYLLYLLRETTFEGSLLNNPYLRSVGLEGNTLEARLRALPGLAFKRQGDLIEYGWRHRDLASWADATLTTSTAFAGGWA